MCEGGVKRIFFSHFILSLNFTELFFVGVLPHKLDQHKIHILNSTSYIFFSFYPYQCGRVYCMWSSVYLSGLLVFTLNCVFTKIFNAKCVKTLLLLFVHTTQA